MKEFTEALRYDYPLTQDSLVLDCGAYQGEFTAEIHRKYGCHIHAFEPVAEFCQSLTRRFAREKNITVHHCAIGGIARAEVIGVQNNSSGLFAGSPVRETIRVESIVHLMGKEFAGVTIDLMKLNIEGMEFEVLEAVLGNGLAHRFRNIQVQPHHTSPDSVPRWKQIQDALQDTHEITFDAPWCWVNFELRK